MLKRDLKNILQRNIGIFIAVLQLKSRHLQSYQLCKDEIVPLFFRRLYTWRETKICICYYVTLEVKEWYCLLWKDRADKFLVILNKLVNSCCCSVAKQCLTVCDPMDCLQHVRLLCPPQSLLKFMSIELVMLSNHLILCCPLLLLPSIFPSIRVFPMSQLFASGGQSIGTSTLARVLPVNIQH